jgi:Arc-like DNA binding domain
MVLLVVPFDPYYLVLRSVEGRKMARKPTETAHLNLRYPEALRRRLERAAKNSGRSMNTEIVERLEQSFRREDFEKVQDAMNMGWLKIFDAVGEVERHLLSHKGPGLLEQLARRRWLSALSDDELAKRIAEAKAAEQMGQAQKQPNPPDLTVPSPHEDTSEQPATHKREDSK